MTFHIWLLFVMTESMLSLSPGPAVLLVVGNGMKAGAEMSRWSAAGILFTNACYFTLSALGLGATLLAAKAGCQFKRPRARLWQEWLSGAMLVTAAVGLSLVNEK